MDKTLFARVQEWRNVVVYMDLRLERLNQYAGPPFMWKGGNAGGEEWVVDTLIGAQLW